MARRPTPPFIVFVVGEDVEPTDPSTGPYNRVIIGMRGWLQDHCARSQQGSEDICRPVLIEDGVNTVPRFRFLDIVFIRARGDRMSTVTVRFRQDNVYALGFQVNDGRWFEFQWDVDRTTGQRPRYLPESQYITGQNGSYNGAMINYVTLGAQGLRRSLDVLIRESASRNPNNNDMGDALGTFAIMFSEAARFDPILQFILRVYQNSPRLSDNLWIVQQSQRWASYSGWVLYYLRHPDEWRPLTVRMATDAGAATDVVVRTVHEMLKLMGILHNNPKDVGPRPKDN